MLSANGRRCLFVMTNKDEVNEASGRKAALLYGDGGGLPLADSRDNNFKNFGVEVSEGKIDTLIHIHKASSIIKRPVHDLRGCTRWTSG